MSLLSFRLNNFHSFRHFSAGGPTRPLRFLQGFPGVHRYQDKYPEDQDNLKMIKKIPELSGQTGASTGCPCNLLCIRSMHSWRTKAWDKTQGLWHTDCIKHPVHHFQYEEYYLSSLVQIQNIYCFFHVWYRNIHNSM